MSKINVKNIKLLIVTNAILFVCFSLFNFIYFQKGTDVWFYVNLTVIIILLVVMLILFEKFIKTVQQNFDNIKNELERKIVNLSEQNNILKTDIELIEEKEKKRFNNQTKEEIVKNLVKDFLKNKDKNYELMKYLIDNFQAFAAILYVLSKPGAIFTVKETYGLPSDFTPASFSAGEGLNGQAALEGKPVYIENIPDDYFFVTSGLGKSKPRHLYLLPVMKDEKCTALIELVSFEKLDLEKIWENIIT